MEADGSTTSASLLLRLGDRPSDQAAWGEFVDRYGGIIYSWCRGSGLQDADAQDVTQAVLTQLAVQLGRFAYDPSRRFRGWLRTLVKNACRDCVADRRHSIGVGSPDGAGRADPLLTVESRDDLARRLEAEFDLELLEEAERRVRRRVAPQTWEAYRLTAVEGLSGAEAAARLGMKVAAVFVSRSHVMKHLRSEVRRLEDNQPGASPPE
jgi:RNA polymerase sigma factor (sigma-70 family)